MFGFKDLNIARMLDTYPTQKSARPYLPDVTAPSKLDKNHVMKSDY